MERLYKFDPVSYYGSLEGVFVADEQEIANLIGQRIYFGEVLGKHSEVWCTITQMEVITEDQDKIAVFKELFPQGIGYNPLEYLEEEE